MVLSISPRLENEHSLKNTCQQLPLLSAQIMIRLDQERHMISRELHRELDKTISRHVLPWLGGSCLDPHTYLS